MFESAAPDLFEKDFESKMKDRAESIKLITETVKSSQSISKKLFLRWPSRPLPPKKEAATLAAGGDAGRRTSPRESDSPTSTKVL